MADGKWISGLDPSGPAADAARAVLAARLAAVRDAAGAAAARSDEDPEHVHQLRVATRRAGAAVAIFRDLLPRKKRRAASAVLRDLRRAAGGARDWDVFAEMLAGSDALRAAGAGSAADLLAGYTLGERTAAQVTLAAVAADLGRDLTRVTRRLPRAVRGRGRRTFAELGLGALGELFAEFTAAAARPRTADDLHQLRIVGKRLRYAMEVFAGCFGPAFREHLYPAVERVQAVLGAVQDGHVAAARLRAVYRRLEASRPALAARVRPGFRGLMREVRARVRAERRAFREWRKEWQVLTARHPLAELLAAPS